MYYFFNKNIVNLVTALFSLLFSIWNSNANENPTQNGFTFGVYNQSNLHSGNYLQYQKGKKISSIKIPVSRRKYFRDERTVAIVDFTNEYSKFDFISSDIKIDNTDQYYKSFLTRPLLRGPPIV